MFEQKNTNYLFKKSKTMKSLFFISSVVAILSLYLNKNIAQPVAALNKAAADSTKPIPYFIDVHDLEPGKVTFDDVVKAHQKDLAIQGKYNVNFLKFWVDEKLGKVYCLSRANNAASVEQTHKEAHGLLPSVIYNVTDGQQAAVVGNKSFFIDVHQLAPGSVTAKDVAAAHTKDLHVQDKYGVNFINYWVDEKKGTIMCLSQAADSNAIKKTHKEAHGLLPDYILEVKQGE